MTISRELTVSGEVPATGPLVLDLGAPASGFQWDVRRLVLVETLTPQTARAATVFVVTPPSGLANPILDPTEIADVTPCGTPAAASWPERTIVIRSNERVQVWAYFDPAAVGVSFVATAQADEDQAR